MVHHVPNPDFVAPPLDVVDGCDLLDTEPPERQWNVAGWIPAGTVTMLNGDGGVGKSLVAQQLLTCAAAGLDWLGLPTEPCPALGFFCEDTREELHRRQAAINRNLGLQWGSLQRGALGLASRVGDDNILLEFGGEDARGVWRQQPTPTPTWQALHNAAQDMGARLVVIDALHDVFGANENNRVQARQFINHLSTLARDCEAAVILCSHPSQSGLNTGSGASGSTAWNNAVRSRLYLTRPKPDDDDAEPDHDARELRRMKANYSGIGDVLSLRWSGGVFVRDEPAGGMVGSIERGTDESRFLDCLDALTQQGRNVSDNNRAANYAPKIMAKQPQAGRIGRKRLARAMEHLFTIGAIEMGFPVIGPDRHPRRGIVRAENDCGKVRDRER